jgi:hypothetical protein
VTHNTRKKLGNSEFQSYSQIKLLFGHQKKPGFGSGSKLVFTLKCCIGESGSEKHCKSHIFNLNDMKKEQINSGPTDVNNKYNSPMKRICVKKAAQFQSAVTGPKIYVHSHLDIIYGLQNFVLCNVL